MYELAPTFGPIVCVVGARPNYMKMAPLLRAFRSDPTAPRTLLVHTGQHYDVAMNDRLFADLKLRAPDVNLDVGSGTHAQQTAEIMQRFEPVVDAAQPSCVVVVGDVNSTLACSLVAVKKAIPVVHVEAGLRSFDRLMPEEVNRLLTDQICDALYTTERSATENLRREGIPMERVHFVGNVMIDSLRTQLDRARHSSVLTRLKLQEKSYAVLTLHRPSNVDEQAAFVRILDALEEIARRLPIVFPAHPRTRKMIDELGLGPRVQSIKDLRVVDPIGYLDFLRLESCARLVLTDSGGIQEETTVLGIPCITLRENTERPITVEMGTNTIAGTDTNKIVAAATRALDNPLPDSNVRIPEFWDGRAADRILDALLSEPPAVAGG